MSGRVRSLAIGLISAVHLGCPAPNARPVPPESEGELSLRFVEYIRAEPEAVFSALTAEEQTRKFFHGTAVRTALQPGGEHNHLSGDGARVVISGTIRAVEAPRLLTFEFRFPEYSDAATLVHYKLEPAGEGTTKLTVEHEGFEGPTRTYRRVFDGWPPVMSGLKTLLESGEPLGVPSFQTPASKEAPPDHPRHRFVEYIRTNPDALWTALTDRTQTVKYFHRFEVDSGWQEGTGIRYLANGSPMIEGEIVDAVEGKRIEFTFNRVSAPDGEAASRVVYEIEDLGEGVCRLVVTHDFTEESDTFKRVGVGWPEILSGLKTLLEAGEPLALG